jgi:aspartate racemase
MGPAATVELFRRIVAYTPAQRDQDHIPIVIDNNPKIPDRGPFLVNGGPDPRPALCRSARRLEKMGASFIAMPCNTAHVFSAPSEKGRAHPVYRYDRGNR